MATATPSATSQQNNISTSAPRAQLGHRSVTSSKCTSCCQSRWFAVAILIAGVVCLAGAAIGVWGLFGQPSTLPAFVNAMGPPACIALASLGTVIGLALVGIGIWAACKTRAEAPAERRVQAPSLSQLLPEVKAVFEKFGEATSERDPVPSKKQRQELIKKSGSWDLNDWNMVLVCALAGGSTELLDQLLNIVKNEISEFDINRPIDTSRHKLTLLLLAVMMNRIDMVDLLIDRGADVNVMNDSGTLPLHVAASSNRRPLAELLIRRGARCCPDAMNLLPSKHLQKGLGDSAFAHVLPLYALLKHEEEKEKKVFLTAVKSTCELAELPELTENSVCQLIPLLINKSKFTLIIYLLSYYSICSNDLKKVLETFIEAFDSFSDKTNSISPLGVKCLKSIKKRFVEEGSQMEEILQSHINLYSAAISGGRGV